MADYKLTANEQAIIQAANVLNGETNANSRLQRAQDMITMATQALSDAKAKSQAIYRAVLATRQPALNISNNATITAAVANDGSITLSVN